MREEKKSKQNGKIKSFHITEEDLLDPEMDEFLRQELMKEADELEERLNKDPKLVGVGVSDDLFASIVGSLKEQGIWKEDEVTGTGESTRLSEESAESVSTETAAAEKKDLQTLIEEETEEVILSEEETLAKLYQMMPEKERQAWELGRKEQAKKEKKALRWKKRAKVYKAAGVAAAMLVCVVGISVSSEANRRIALQAWGTMMETFGFRTRTNSIEGVYEARRMSEEEAQAYKEINEKLGIGGVDFIYLPEGMKFSGYDNTTNERESILFYIYQDALIYITIMDTDKEYVSYYSFDDRLEKIETVRNANGGEGEIWGTKKKKSDKESNIYIGQAEYKECRCIINGMLPVDELKKMMQMMYFL